MYELSNFSRYDDYFKQMAQRSGKGVLFCRFIGYDENTLVFFRQLQMAAEDGGAYIRQTLGNPGESQVSGFSQAVDLSRFQPDKPYLLKAVNAWLPEIPPAKRLQFSDAVQEMASFLMGHGSNVNILKNMFVKWMCWSKNNFSAAIRRSGDAKLPKILYEGDISKHEVYMLRILSRTGCDVAYINYSSDSSYLKADASGAFSELVSGSHKNAPKKHFSTIDLKHLAQIEEMKSQAKAASGMLATNTWLRTGLLEEILKSNKDRGALGEQVCNLYGRYWGVDEQDAYLARLYKLKETLLRGSKPLVMVESRLTNPTLDEVKAIKTVTYQKKEELAAKLAASIDLPGNQKFTMLVRSAFVSAISCAEGSLPKVYNSGMKLLCWFNRYRSPLFGSWKAEAIPVFFYYGACGDSEAEFFNMLSAMPVDVLVVSPDKAPRDAFKSLGERDRGVDEVLPQSMSAPPFPQTEPKVRSSTVAYQAARELDSILYNDSGLFRNRQFTRCNPVTLKTTYDEIEILWKEEAKFRPSFEAGNGRVAVPNLFARVCGVRDGDTAAYFRSIENLFTDKTVYLRALPCLTPQTPNSIRSSVHKFFENGSILPDKIKNHRDYLYDYLSENTQDYILEKIQQMIDLKWVKSDSQGVELTILATLLNLDKTTLRLIQQFDFTRDIPKVIVTHVDESMPSLEDCIYLAFLNLAGFDIVIFTPTGYRDLDKYILPEAYEEHQIGTYMFNLLVPNMRWRGKQSTAGNGGLLGKLFGKG